MNVLDEAIISHEFFRGMKHDHLAVLTQGARAVRFKAGDILFQIGEPANQFYLIQSGKIALEADAPAGGGTLVQTLGPGEVLGWSWLFPPFVWHFQARALDPTDVIALSGAHLLVTAERDPEFGFELMKRVVRVVIHRLQATRKQLLALRAKPGLKEEAGPKDALPSAPARIISPIVYDIIAAHPFFKQLNPRYVHLLAECASVERFGVGQELFREGQPADRFYVLHRGRVALETLVPGTGATTVQTVEAGGALGWSWLYPPYQWQFSARAVQPVEAVVFAAASLREKAEENHDFGYELLTRLGRVMLEMLQGTRRKLVESHVRDLVH